MSRRNRRPSAFLRDTTGHGFLVTVTLCASLLACIAVTVVLALNGQDVPETLDRTLSALMLGVPTLLAKARRDAPHDATEPVAVKADEALPVRPATADELEREVVE